MPATAPIIGKAQHSPQSAMLVKPSFLKSGVFFFVVSIVYFFSCEGLDEQFLSQEFLPHFPQPALFVAVLSVVELHDFLPQQFFTASHEVSENEASISTIADAFKMDFFIVLFDL